MQKAQITRTKEKNGIQVVRIYGDFTNDTTPEYQQICEEVAGDPKTRAILLDLKEVDRIDTSAFACMVGLLREHFGENAKVGIMNLDMSKRALVDLLRLNHFIMVFGDEKEALDALSNPIGKEEKSDRP